jgi:5'-nucleotidase
MPLRKSLALSLAFALCLPATTSVAAGLTLLHNNDGESKLTGSGGFGGVANFAKVVGDTRAAAQAAGRDVIFVSSGDNVLAGLAFTASRRAGVYYDATAQARLGYDAITLGNHDFDFGPEVLADIIAQYASNGGRAPFLSANLDFATEPTLQAHATAGRIAKSAVIVRGGERYGIVAATTETLPTVSSPGRVAVGSVLAAVRAEVSRLKAQGINRIILSSHLQGVASELALIAQLTDVDVVIAGGGDEYLINPATGGDRYSDTLDGVDDIPDDGFERRFGGYPLVAKDADGRDVPVVTTVGEYRYLGRLDVEFDVAGNVTSWTGNPILVDPRAAGATPDPALVADVIDPLIAAQASLASNVIGSTDVGLNGRRGTVSDLGGTFGATIPGVRNRETNEGSLVADALLWKARNTPGSLLNPLNVAVALTNGGGIRNDNVIGPGVLSEKDTIDMLPFDNYVTVVNNVSVAALKDMLENAVSRWEFGDGRFAQIAGFRFYWDPRQPGTKFATGARTMDDVAEPGRRVRRIEFLDGRTLFDARTGVVYGGLLDVVTNSFVASGGDGYDFAGDNRNDDAGTPSLPRSNLPASYQQALFDYVKDELRGSVSASKYPANGPGRIVQVETLIEYYNAVFDHYFLTSVPDEIGKLDKGTLAGWNRTGQKLSAWSSAGSGTAPVCRFYSASFAAKPSHFLTPISSECEAVKRIPSWIYEGEVFHAGLPDGSGACGGEAQPVYRVYNNGQGNAPSHRFTTDRALRQAMLSRGWLAEGVGDGVIWCAPI